MGEVEAKLAQSAAGFWESRWSNNWQRKGIGTLVLFDKEVNMEWFTFLKNNR